MLDSLGFKSLDDLIDSTVRKSWLKWLTGYWLESWNLLLPFSQIMHDCRRVALTIKYELGKLAFLPYLQYAYIINPFLSRSSHLFTYPLIYLSSIYVSVCLSIYLSVCVCLYAFVCVCLSACLSVCVRSVCVCVCVCVYLCVPVGVCLCFYCVPISVYIVCPIA